MGKYFLIFFILSTFIITGCDDDISGCFETSSSASGCTNEQCCKEKLNNKKAWYEESRSSCRTRVCIQKIHGSPSYEYSGELSALGDIGGEGHSAELYGTENNEIRIIRIGKNWYNIDANLPKGSYVKIQDSWYKVE